MNNCENCGVTLEEGQIGWCNACQENEVNDNCLEGMRCPKCKSIEPFEITSTCTASVYDSGVDESFDFEWNDDDACKCVECSFAASVKDFQIANQPKESTDASKSESKP